MYASFNARAVGLADLPVATTIDITADAGFAGVDLMIRDLVRSGADLGAVRNRMAARGLRAGAFPMTMNWRGDEASFRRDLAELPSLARAAASLGFTRTGTWVLPETSTSPALDADLAWFRAGVAQLHVERIGAIARILADHAIRVGLEVIGVASFRSGRGVPFITRMSDLEPSLTALREIPNVGLLVDVFHLHAADEPIETALTWGSERIIWAHVADLPPGGVPNRLAIIDAERGLPGTRGGIDCGRFLGCLNDAGYDGPVTVEPLARCAALLDQEPAEVARRVKRALDGCWPAAG